VHWDGKFINPGLQNLHGAGRNYVIKLKAESLLKLKTESLKPKTYFKFSILILSYCLVNNISFKKRIIVRML
jgi:hypothetical protein